MWEGRRHRHCRSAMRRLAARTTRFTEWYMDVTCCMANQWRGVWNGIKSPALWARPPKKLMRWRAFSLRTYTHLYAPIRTVRTVHTVRTAFGHLAFLPSHRKPNQKVCSVKRHWCKCTSRRHQDDIKSVCCLWQHCTWEFLIDERHRSRGHSGSQEHTSTDNESGRHQASFDS